MLNKALRLFHTVKYLKVKQIVWRGVTLLPKMVKETSNYPDTLDIQNDISFIKRNGFTSDYKKFTFLSETNDISEIGWDNYSISKLWRYNLHYFEFLLQDTQSPNHVNKQIELIDNWMEFNPYGKGTAWEPYPTSLRIINWIKWHFVTGGLTDKAKRSLWNQVRWLSARPEYHLLGNHLFINIKALIFASSFFQLSDDSKIFRKAISVLESELDEQFLGDGAHFELSPMYHSLAMEDLLDLLNLSNKLPLSFPKSEIENKCINGMKWLKTMAFNNDELSHFNDCANGISLTYNKLKTYAASSGLNFSYEDEIPFYNYKESGFIVFKDAHFHLIADVGKVGPNYLPGHAHADTLSFELAIKGQRVIVNSGTSLYGTSPERLRQRGTVSHSTVQLDAQNSSDVWSGFRVGRRAKPFNIQINAGQTLNSQVNFNASHDGYRFLKNSPIHTRSWIFKGIEWDIKDEISGDKNMVTSRYYLHPDIQIEASSKGYILSKNAMQLAELEIYDADKIEIINTTYHDQFGISMSNKCIYVNAISPCEFGIKIQLL